MHLFEKQVRPAHPEHEAIHQQYREKKEAVRSALVHQFISRFGESAQGFVAGLKAAVGANMYWHLSEILGASRLYETQEVAGALSTCSAIGVYHKNSVIRLLNPDKLMAVSSDATSGMVRWPRSAISRSLSAYAGVGELTHE